MNNQNKTLKKYDISSLILESSFGIIIVVVLFSICMIIFTDNFLSATNFFATSRAFSLWIIVAFAQMMALVIGQMNISVGAIGGLSAVAVGYLFQYTGFPIWVVVLTGLLVGIACGLINGVIITRTGINPFVVTLGTFSVFTGMIYGLTHSLPFSKIPTAFTFVGKTKILGAVPLLLFIMLIIALLLYILFNHTVLGRRILATGGNAEAALLSGINTKNVILLAHIFSGLLAALGGILFVARLGAAHPTIGQNWLLMSFAIPVIGGVSMQGGKTSILGVIFGGILMTFISNGLVLLQVDIFWLDYHKNIVKINSKKKGV